MTRGSIEDYQVGWICALPKELTAARAMLDEEYEDRHSHAAQDHNSYVLGRVHEHNVVMACLPVGEYGTVSAATVATNMSRTFTSIRFGLMVGIGGGIPNLDKNWDIRLGDVVVSEPDGMRGGVIQYDLRKNLGQGQLEPRGCLRAPPTLLLTALANLRSRHNMYGHQISETLASTFERLPRLAKSGYTRPDTTKDLLRCVHTCDDPELESCSRCRLGIVQREQREDEGPEVHYGIIASGNELMKNAIERDRIGQEFGAKCLEMEAAGLMNDFPCLVIRGICDYADRAKNDDWQEYAALTAAAFAKELLGVIKSVEVAHTKRATESTKYDLGLNLFDAPVIGKDLFIGRKPEIEKMNGILQPQPASSKSSREVLILGGLGGIGKTQLALAYVKEYRTAYSSIFWINANSETVMKTSFRSLAYRIMPFEVAKQMEDDEIQIRVSNWLSEPGNTQWLLIFDNYDDPDRYNIRTYFPAAAHGSVIITTRQPRTLNGSQLKLSSMENVEEGLQILATRSVRHHAGTDAAARKLVERLGGYPLALATAGAFLKESSVTFAEYLQQYNIQWKALDTIDELPEYPSRTLFSTWNLSVDQIRRKDSNAASLLRFFGFLNPGDIWYELLHSGGQNSNRPRWFVDVAKDRFAFERTMMVLTKYGLVETSHEPGSYNIHVCVHDWIMYELNHEVDMTLYRTAIDCISYHVPVSDFDNFSSARYNRLIPHAQHLVHAHLMAAFDFEDFSLDTMRALSVMGNLLAAKGQFAAAESLQRHSLSAHEQALGSDHLSTLRIVNDLGVLHRLQGKLNEAEPMLHRALIGYEQILGPNHRSTLDTINNLGVLYNYQNKLEQAEKMARRALDWYEQSVGRDDPSTFSPLNNLGVVYKAKGKFEQAEQMFQRALAGCEQQLGPNHVLTLNTVHNLGTLYEARGRLVEAEQLYQRALDGCEQELGTSHPSTLLTVYKLGVLHAKQGRKGEAEEKLQRAIAGFEQSLGPNNLSTLDTINSLGILYQDQGRLNESERLFQQALAGFEQGVGPKNLSTLDIINNLGCLYWDQGRLGKAEQSFQRALDGYEQNLGPDDPSTLAAANNLGIMCRGQGKLDEAEKLFQRALDGYEQNLSTGNVATATLNMIHNLGLLYFEQGKMEEARDQYQRAMAGFEKILGPKHPKTIRVRDTLNQMGPMIKQPT